MYIKNRIKLLPDEEIGAIYMLPVFNRQARLSRRNHDFDGLGPVKK